MDGILDTAIIVDIYRGFTPAVQWLQQNTNKVFSIAPIVWLEAVEGVSNKLEQSKIIKLLQLFAFVNYTQSDMLWAMQQLEQYHLSHSVSMMDCLITASAQRLQLPLLTRNLKHFSPILPTLAQKPY